MEFDGSFRMCIKKFLRKLTLDRKYNEFLFRICIIVNII